jgi:hypothetical protein
MLLRQCDEILHRERPLGENALPRKCAQLTLFPCDPIEKRSKLIGHAAFCGKTRLNVRNRLSEHAL